MAGVGPVLVCFWSVLAGFLSAFGRVKASDTGSILKFVRAHYVPAQPMLVHFAALALRSLCVVSAKPT